MELLSRNSPATGAPDLAGAQCLADQLVRGAGTSLQQVTLIGSRSRGDAKINSDFDFVALVEPQRTKEVWCPRHNLAEKQRLLHLFSGRPERVELWVRTTDQYAEARHVFGCPEELVDFEGITLYSRPYSRSPVIRRGPNTVRLDNVADWFEGALINLDAAIASPRCTGGPTRAQSGGDVRLQATVNRAITALCVMSQIRASTKHTSVISVLEKLRPAIPEVVANLTYALGSDKPIMSIATSTLVVVHAHIVKAHPTDQRFARFAGRVLQATLRVAAFG